jgi:DNA polymerase-3 subunit delta
VLSGAPEAFNLDRLEGELATPGGLLDAVRTLPVLASRRLVWLREPGAGRASGASLLEALPAVVREVVQGSTSVLVVTAREAPARAAWVRVFDEPAARVACDAPRAGRALVAFVRKEAERQGVALGPGAAERLAERVGPQLLMIRHELAKAALLAGDGGSVSEATVIAAVADVAEEPIWELTDAIGDGRAGDALAVLAKLAAGGAAPVVVLASLAAHFRKLARLSGGGQVPGPPFVVEKLSAQARRYSSPRVLACLRAIHDTDEILKGQGGLGPELALERLVLALAA